MSHTEIHIGKLRPVELKGKELEQWCKELCQSKHKRKQEFKLPQGYDTWVHYFRSECQYESDFKILQGKLYELYDHLEGDEINKFEEHPDGTISFTIQFYNGSGNFDEALNWGVEDINKKQSINQN